MSFLDLKIKKEYRVPADNIINDFYIPLLNKSILYQRSVAYFSSESLYEISYGIVNLLKNNGKIQLIVSPILSDEDIEAINKGYKAREDVIEQALLQYITEPKDYFEKKRLNILEKLIDTLNKILSVTSFGNNIIKSIEELVLAIFALKLGRKLIKDIFGKVAEWTKAGKTAGEAAGNGISKGFKKMKAKIQKAFSDVLSGDKLDFSNLATFKEANLERKNRLLNIQNEELEAKPKSR